MKLSCSTWSRNGLMILRADPVNQGNVSPLRRDRDYVYRGPRDRYRQRTPMKEKTHVGYPPSHLVPKWYGHGRDRVFGMAKSFAEVQWLNIHNEWETWIVFDVITNKLEYKTFRWRSFDET